MSSLSSLPRLVGVIHLPALAGSPGAAGFHPQAALQQAGLRAVKEAEALARAGFDGLILENFGDVPFYRDRVPPETIASMAVIAAAVREATRLPLGINVLRNDAFAALGIAAVTGSQFIRVNVLSGVAATDQGLIEGRAAELIRERDRLGGQTAILADAHVKHARSLSSDSIGLAVEETALRAGADGVVLTGPTTGREVDRSALTSAHRVARAHGIGLWIGSGATVENLGFLLAHARGVIVGSTLRKGGKAGAPLDARRLKEFAVAYRGLTRKGRGAKKKSR